MTNAASILSLTKPSIIKVWVLAPYLITNDDNLNYYYDFSQSIAEYTAVFAQLGLAWQWQPVTIGDYEKMIEKIVIEKQAGEVFPIVINLCDGDEVNGTPGVSIIHCLDAFGLAYTGADAHFYNVTTSKIVMKEAFEQSSVATPLWSAIITPEAAGRQLFNILGTPIIVKPSVSGGSMGVGIKNVVYNEQQLLQQLQTMFAGYRGWNLATGGIVAEAFIEGPEFTVLIAGSYDTPNDAMVYTPVERVFHDSLPPQERFLSFDRLWEIYEDETPMPNNENFYEYQTPHPSLHNAIKQLAWESYVSVKGTGYARIDIRMDTVTGKMYVLEVNAQCGISEDENFTSIGAILRLCNISFSTLVMQILKDGLQRYQSKNKVAA